MSKKRISKPKKEISKSLLEGALSELATAHWSKKPLSHSNQPIPKKLSTVSTDPLGELATEHCGIVPPKGESIDVIKETDSSLAGAVELGADADLAS